MELCGAGDKMEMEISEMDLSLLRGIHVKRF
jgi:hypothetical protein